MGGDADDEEERRREKKHKKKKKKKKYYDVEKEEYESKNHKSKQVEVEEVKEEDVVRRVKHSSYNPDIVAKKWDEKPDMKTIGRSNTWDGSKSSNFLEELKRGQEIRSWSGDRSALEKGAGEVRKRSAEEDQEQQWRGERHLEAEVESLANSHIDEHTRLLVVFVFSDQDQQCEEGEVGAA